MSSKSVHNFLLCAILLSRYNYRITCCLEMETIRPTNGCVEIEYRAFLCVCWAFAIRRSNQKQRKREKSPVPFSGTEISFRWVTETLQSKGQQLRVRRPSLSLGAVIYLIVANGLVDSTDRPVATWSVRRARQRTAAFQCVASLLRLVNVFFYAEFWLSSTNDPVPACRGVTTAMRHALLQ